MPTNSYFWQTYEKVKAILTSVTVQSYSYLKHSNKKRSLNRKIFALCKEIIQIFLQENKIFSTRQGQGSITLRMTYNRIGLLSQF